MFKRKNFIAQAVAIGALLLLLMSIPKEIVERARTSLVALVAPLTAAVIGAGPRPEGGGGELSQVELENQLLKNENRRIRQLFEHELHIIAELSFLLNDNEEALKLHSELLKSSLDKQLTSLPAQVVFRSPSSWNSSLWVDVGEVDNEKLGKKIVEINSPALVGKHVVGVVDYVGSAQSRVRLITDSGLTPSVRASRGGEQNIEVQEEIQVLRSLIATSNSLFASQDEKKAAIEELDRLRERLIGKKETYLLAKGVLHGSSSEMWRKPGQTLKGIGFNYDYSDAEGPARDLRSGTPINAPASIPTMPIIKEGDTLVTTGYDGVFPRGLSVAIVTHIELLKEGDYYYELEALPSAGDLDSLETLYILPKRKWEMD